MTHTFEQIETLARRLCLEGKGDWNKRRAYWTRKALIELEGGE